MVMVNVRASPILSKLVDAYREVEERFPGDRLLNLVEIRPNEVVFSDEYRERFVDPRDDFGSFGWKRYTEALNSVKV